MYSEKDFVRLETNNELRQIKRVVDIGGKKFYVCNNNIWYDEELIYPANFKIEVKKILNEQIFLSDFGQPKKVVEDFVKYIKDDSEKFEKFLNIIRNSDLSFDENPFE